MWYLLNGKNKEKLKASTRRKLFEKVKGETKLAIKMCREKATERTEQLMMDWLDYMVSIVEKRKFGEANQDLKAVLVEECQEVLEMIFDVTSFENLIEMFRDPKRNVVGSHYLMEKTVDHFRELEVMAMTSVDARAVDTAELNRDVHLKKIGANPMEDEVNVDSNTLMLYKNCHHTFPVAPNVKDGKVIQCKACFDTDQNVNCQYYLDRITYPREIPFSDQFEFQRTGKLLLDVKTNESSVKEFKMRSSIFDNIYTEAKRSMLYNELFDF